MTKLHTVGPKSGVSESLSQTPQRPGHLAALPQSCGDDDTKRRAIRHGTMRVLQIALYLRFFTLFTMFLYDENYLLLFSRTFLIIVPK